MRSRYQSSSRACGSSPALVPVEPRALERLDGLRIGHVVERPAVRRRTPPGARAARRRRCAGSVWSVKYMPRRRGAPLLAHEQHRRARRGQQERGAARPGSPGDEAGREPVALARGCRPGRASAARRRSASPACAARSTGRPCARPPEASSSVPSWKKTPLEHLRRARRGGEVGVVALRLAGERDVQRVVHVVGPLRVEAEAAGLAARDQCAGR